MKQAVQWLGGTLSAIAAYLAARLGGFDTALEAMFFLMALDMLTGLLCAFGKRSDHTGSGGFLAREMFLGLTRKLLMVALVMLGTALDSMLHLDGLSRAAVIGFYAANEGLSIVENAALLGVPFPQTLLDALDKMQGSHPTEEL